MPFLIIRKPPCNAALRLKSGRLARLRALHAQAADLRSSPKSFDSKPALHAPFAGHTGGFLLNTP